MDARENSKLLLQQQSLGEQRLPYQYSYPSITLFPQNPHTHVTNLYPLLSNEANRGYSFTPREASSGDSSDVVGEHSGAKSDTDSCSEAGVDGVSDDEMSLEELMLHDGKTRKKIEVLAAMVGVDSTEPAMVLTEVVRVLKHLKRINQF